MTPHAKIPLRFQTPRGVHEQPFHSSEGSLVLVAVSDAGREVARITVGRLEDYNSAHDYLRDVLSLADPSYRAVTPSPEMMQ